MANGNIYRKSTFMIRPLSETDHDVVVTFLSQAPQYNLYILGNLEKLGFDHAFCEYWGDFADDTQSKTPTLRGVINRYMSGWTIYGEPGTNWAGLAKTLDNHPIQAERLQDNPGGIDSFLPFLQRFTSEKTETEEVMTLERENLQPVNQIEGVTVRRGTMRDLARLTRFYGVAEHMTRSAAAVERPLRDTRLWLAEADGEILSTALTNAETTALAMIGGVYTPPAARGRRLSQAVCHALCSDLIAAGKQPVLYWSTPAAGAVYRKLGFHACGQWRSIWLIPTT
jgi:predicted GNAT family acetyltransferase